MKPRPTSKTILIILLIAVLAVIGFVIYSHKAAKVTPINVPETTAVPTTPSAWPSTKVSEQKVTDSASYYTINAVYPVTKDDVITGYFKTFIDSNIAQFKDDSSWAAGDGANAAPAEAANLSLTITYTETKSSLADNYDFLVDTYTGGAHDLQATKTFSFSATGQQITLDSLFTNTTTALKLIAPYVQKQLATRQYADDTMIKEGTDPTADNFSDFKVTDTGITFIFDPYQVAPYAAGIETVDVPLSVFKSAANKDVFSQ